MKEYRDNRGRLITRWYTYAKSTDFRIDQFNLPFWAVGTIKVGTGNGMESSYNDWYRSARDRQEKRFSH